MRPGGPEAWLLAAVLLVCLGGLPILALFSSMFHLARGHRPLARVLALAALAGAGLQWLGVLAGAWYFSGGGPVPLGGDTFGWVLRLPLPVLALTVFAVVTTLGGVWMNLQLEKEGKGEGGGNDGDGR